jgi:beta-xylosidase
LEKPCRITRYKLGKNHNSVFGNWLKLGRPDILDKDLIKKINFASAPDIEFGFVKYDKDIVIESNISSFEIELIDIEMI